MRYNSELLYGGSQLRSKPFSVPCCRTKGYTAANKQCHWSIWRSNALLWSWMEARTLFNDILHLKVNKCSNVCMCKFWCTALPNIEKNGNGANQGKVKASMSSDFGNSQLYSNLKRESHISTNKNVCHHNNSKDALIT